MHVNIARTSRKTAAFRTPKTTIHTNPPLCQNRSSRSRESLREPPTSMKKFQPSKYLMRQYVCIPNLASYSNLVSVAPASYHLATDVYSSPTSFQRRSTIRRPQPRNTKHCYPHPRKRGTYTSRRRRKSSHHSSSRRSHYTSCDTRTSRARKCGADSRTKQAEERASAERDSTRYSASVE
jgi:hypothetical protein